MNSKKSYSSISIPFIVENLKRFWIGSAFALIGYLCACCVPLLMGGVHNGNVSSILRVSYAPVIIMTVVVPLVAAMLIYSYMQQQSSAAIVHSLPYTRKQLFHSSYISGVILCIAPILITGIILTLTSIFSEPVLFVDFDPDSGFISYDIFTPEKVLIWTGTICLFNIVVFTLAAFSAVLTGSVLVQAMLSIVLLFIAPALLRLASLVGERMLYGYIEPEWILTLFSYTSAPIAMVEESNIAVLCQVCIALILYVLSYFLYSRRHMEKARETLVFDTVKPIVKYAVAFIGMCCFGFFLDGLYGGGGDRIFYSGAFIGALIAYVAADMLIQKRIKIKGFVKGFGLYLAAAVIFFGIFAFDLAGYETAIPDKDEVKGVRISGISEEYYRHYDNENPMIKDPMVIANILAVHSDLISERDRFFNIDRNNYYMADTVTASSYPAYGRPAEDNYSWVYIEYLMDNGKTLEREYDAVPMSWLYDNENLRKAVESEAYKEKMYPVISWNYEEMKISDVKVLPNYEGDVCGKQSLLINEEDKMKQLYEAYTEDVKSLSFDEMNLSVHNNRTLLTLEFAAKNGDVISEELNKKYYDHYGYYYNEEYDYYTYDVNIHYTNTLALLEEWGVYDDVIVSVEDISHASVVKVEKTDTNAEKAYPEVNITDRESLQNILTTANNDYFNYELRYEITLYPIKSGAAGERIYLYYDGNYAPEFITEAF